VAFVLEFQWNESNVDRTISVTIHDEDGAALGPGAVGAINVGHPPLAVHGAPILTPFALTFTNLKFEHPGRYSFRLVIDQTEYAKVGFSVRRPLMPTAPQP
jgi:hypothetical protein